jgi:hypothetical protein
MRLTTQGLVDEFWFWVSPPCGGPDRVFRWNGPVRLELIGSTTFPSGVLRLAYRPAPQPGRRAPGEPVTAAEPTRNAQRVGAAPVGALRAPGDPME